MRIESVHFDSSSTIQATLHFLIKNENSNVNSDLEIEGWELGEEKLTSVGWNTSVVTDT